MRDYDPTTGRYIQADPLGLVDGASVYGYALQNPGRYYDPTGQYCLPCAILVGASARAALGEAFSFGRNPGENFSNHGLNFYCYDWEELAWNDAGAACGALSAKGLAKLAGKGEIPKWLAAAGIGGTGTKSTMSKWYHKEVFAPSPVKPSDATDSWNDLLGPGPHTNIHPRPAQRTLIG